MASRANVATIICPDLECDEVLSDQDIKAAAPPSTYARHNAICKRAEDDKKPGWRWCLRASCEAGQQHLNGSAVCVCNSCGASACVRCDRPFHQGETCVAYRARTGAGAKEKATRDTISETTGKCPGCGIRVELVDGCYHILCKLGICNSQGRRLRKVSGTRYDVDFCIGCGRTHDSINEYGHDEGCRRNELGAA